MLPLSAAQPTGSATTRLESPCAASTYPAYVFGVGVFTMSSYTYEASTVFDQIESADPCTTCAGSGHGGDGGGPVLAVGVSAWREG